MQSHGYTDGGRIDHFGSWAVVDNVLEVDDRQPPSHSDVLTWAWPDLIALLQPARIDAQLDKPIVKAIDANLRIKRYVGFLRSIELVREREFTSEVRAEVIRAAERLEPHEFGRQELVRRSGRAVAIVIPILTALPVIILASKLHKVSVDPTLYCLLVVALAVSAAGVLVSSVIRLAILALAVIWCLVLFVDILVDSFELLGAWPTFFSGYTFTAWLSVILWFMTVEAAVRWTASRITRFPLDVLLVFLTGATGQLAVTLKYAPHLRQDDIQHVKSAAYFTERAFRRVPDSNRDGKELVEHYRNQGRKISRTLHAHIDLLVNPDPRRLAAAIESLSNGIEHVARGDWEALAIVEPPSAKTALWIRLRARITPLAISLAAALVGPLFWPGQFPEGVRNALIAFAIISLVAPDPGKARDFVGSLIAPGK